MLGYFLNPVQRCCITEDGPCIRGGLRDPTAEIFDSTPALPSTVEVLVSGKFSAIMQGSDRSSGNYGNLPAGPQERVIRTFATSEDEPLRGDPLHSGSILQLKLGVAIEDISLTLYINGFSRVPQSPDQEVEPQATPPSGRTWSPFSLVEKCQVKTMQHSSLWAVFKLTVFRQEGDDRYYYFATTGKDAFRERDKWVEHISNTIRAVTLSLFPPHAITVRPLPGVDSTSTRIMAGYLLRSQATDVVSLFYCELHAYSAGGARLSIYKDEWCEREVAILMLTDQTVVSTRKGSYCTVFGVDQHRFCARTRDEKELWLRAVSNIKVKLMFDAPDPTSEELAVFRAAVLERIVKLECEGGGADDGKASLQQERWDPLLPQVPRPPMPQSPRGDIWYPEPLDENETAEPLSHSHLEVMNASDDEPDVSPVETRQTPTVDTSEALQPDDCRKLLAGIEVGMKNDMPCTPAIDSGVIANEHPGDIRTVHTTEKVLVAQHPPECDLPQEMCGIGCFSERQPVLKGSQPRLKENLEMDLSESRPPSIPLLMWSPGRRQQSQRAV